MIFRNFPREIAYPKREVVFNRKQYLDLINRINYPRPKLNTFTSVYSFEKVTYEDGRQKPIYESARLNKIFFDFDEDDSYECMLRLHQYLMKEDYKHIIFFSGRGYHCYLYLEQKNIINKKNCILKIQKYFDNKLKLSLDRQTLGNLAQMGRVPNTYNLKRRRYCIPLTEEDINTSHDKIKELALKQKFSFSFYGNKLFNPTAFDKKLTKNEKSYDIVNIKITDCNLSLDNIPPCIANIINNPNAGYRERGLLIIYLRDSGYTMEECDLILKSFLDNKKYRHSKKTEGQVLRLYRKSEYYMFPKCVRLMEEGICPGKCKKINKVIYI